MINFGGVKSPTPSVSKPNLDSSAFEEGTKTSPNDTAQTRPHRGSYAGICSPDDSFTSKDKTHRQLQPAGGLRCDCAAKERGTLISDVAGVVDAVDDVESVEGGGDLWALFFFGCVQHKVFRPAQGQTKVSGAFQIISANPRSPVKR